MADNNEAIVKALDETTAAEQVDSVNCPLYEKSQSLVDIANNTFKELCRTLENEQTKLLELEERRKKLQEEMQRLKMEIEEEKKSYHVNVMDIGGADSRIELINSEASSSTSVDYTAQNVTKQENSNDFNEHQQADLSKIGVETMSLHQLDTCFEMDENNEENQDDLTVQNCNGSQSQLSIDAEEIQKQLQSVVTECIIEQCKLDNENPTSHDSEVA